MPKVVRRIFAFKVGVASTVIALSASARAQGFAVDRFEPTPAGDVFFASDFARYSGSDRFALRGGLLGNYAYHPLVVRRSANSVDPVIAQMFTLYAGLTLSVYNRVDVSLNLPTALYQSGGVGTPSSQISAFDSVAIGDIRAGVRGRIWGEADRDPISLHLGAYGYLGSGSRGANVSDGSPRARLYVTAAGRVGWARYSISAGLHGRPTTVTEGTTIGSEVFVTAAAGLTALHDRLMLGGEFFAGTVLSNSFDYKHNNAEAIFGVHYTFADAIVVGLGAGPGLTQGAGTPSFRGLLRVQYAPAPARPAPPPRPIDTDADGVFDPLDLCPMVPMGPMADPARRGCPLEDRDRDGVVDGDDQCPEEPRGEHPDPARAGCPIGDADRDSVLDDSDSCRDEPQGEHPDPERAGCPDGDTDRDGVLNHADQCPAEAQGPRPDPARAGCPAPDRDHDTVIDTNDHCPDEPGAPDPDPNRNGCPGLVRVEAGLIRIVNPVFFATNRDRILARSFAVLTAVGNVLRVNTDIRRVSVEGHTDDVGDDAQNMDLSQRRAASVVRWLTESGIDPSRLESHGYGETRPVRPGTHHADRAANRRVEFHIIDPAPAAPAEPTTPPAAAPTVAPTPPEAPGVPANIEPLANQPSVGHRSSHHSSHRRRH